LNPTKVYWVHRNYLRGMLKNFELSSLFRGLPQFLLFTAAKSVGLGLAGIDGALFWAPWRAIGWNILVLRDTLKLRRGIQASRRVGDSVILQVMGPKGFEPAASLRRRFRISSPP